MSIEIIFDESIRNVQGVTDAVRDALISWASSSEQGLAGGNDTFTRKVVVHGPAGAVAVGEILS
jgi:hypothetical protein